METSAIISEIGAIADTLTDSPLYFKSRDTREGVEAMIQAAAAFAKSSNASEKLSAALWIGEAYLIFSRSLPDAGHSEHDTAWATANQIAKLLGGPEVWEQRIRAEFL